jgi:hypothetical protein
MARITTDAWVMGIIVGALHVYSKVITLLALDATGKSLADFQEIE